ncbi:MAG: hypothetical protein HGA61_00535 [Candidatus Moranbacteria bacterium]|nr:hypothetical protein [Candidatus Moranbacteria bacterium]
MKKIFAFFDRLEDFVRGFLSRHPISYAFIGGIGVVLFWRGIWHLMDLVVYLLDKGFPGELVWWDGILSLAVGSVLLLLTGTFISSFIGNELIISGIKGEKKLTEKTETEIREEAKDLESMKKRLERIEKLLLKK